ncbi:MAG TPA: BON domain-containing protein [Gemmatimonadaceae bacterium]|nr:BON domain-containing protein [Gemmatimonadaceae bacterium]
MANRDYDRERNERGDYDRSGNWNAGDRYSDDRPRYGDRAYANRYYGTEYDRGPYASRNPEWWGYGTQHWGENEPRDWRARYGGGWGAAQPNFGGYGYGVGYGPSFGGYGAYGDYRGYTGYGYGGYGYGASAERSRAGSNYAGRGPRGYTRSDERIREDVNDRLTWSPELDASGVEVKVENGEVTLTGTVDDRHAKRLAEDLAEDVFGVRDVHNELHVEHGFFDKLFGRDEEREVPRHTERENASTSGRRTSSGGRDRVTSGR